MTLTELRYIVAVEQERHFGRAAQKCFVSQPTLSIAIKKLEEELGVMLFDRSNSDIAPTPIGTKIIQQAQHVLEVAEEIRTLALAGQHPLEGALKLGLIFTIAPYLLPKLMLALRTIAPQMPLILDENYTDNLTAALKRGDLDAVIAAEPLHETGLVSTPLYEEDFFVIVPKGHAFEELDHISSQAIAEEKVLLLTEGNCMRDQILQSCQELAAQQRIAGLANTLQGSSINTIKHMVASGLGISVLPSSAITDNDHLLFSVVPFIEPPKRRVILLARRHYARPQALSALHAAVLASKLAGVSFIDVSPMKAFA